MRNRPVSATPDFTTPLTPARHGRWPRSTILQARTFKDFNLWGGLLARIKEGAWLDLKQRPVDGAWLPYFMESYWEGKIAMMKKVGDHYRLERSDFERGSADKRTVK